MAIEKTSAYKLLEKQIPIEIYQAYFWECKECELENKILILKEKQKRPATVVCKQCGSRWIVNESN